jgi:broad specificity phosphatase PhoE
MSMLRLLLIRHGVTEWNQIGRLMGRMAIGLAPQGRAQIERLAAALESVTLDAVFCSPQQRTQETAALIAAPHSLSVLTEDALDEVWLGPRWQGKTFADIRDDADFVALRANPLYTCEGIEPIEQVQRRIVGALDRLRHKRDNGTIALVSHGDPLRALLVHLLSMPLCEYRRLTVNTGSVSVVELHNDRPRLLAMSWKPADGLDRALALT